MKTLVCLTNLFRTLAVLLILLMVMINSATTLEISPAVGSVITFSACFAVELAMLFQTIKNREANSCRQNFGYKLIFVTLLMISSLVTLLIGIF